ncbi:MAG: NAD(P)/FAD-dependent oxidoreductase [Candidatus Aminicenantes bacterium]|nr:NAD(P)/FAD-dependent oxidoreductase [Candidatus Aminicenantes bacterium]
MKILIIGAGPAGLTAGYELVKNGHQVIILEKESQVGGISRTINYKGYLFDLGGHRFFTKYNEVEKIWKEVLPDDFLKRPRLSRIFFKGKFFYYPLKPFNALINLGPARAVMAVLSYFKARLFPYKNPDTFEKWVTNKFGRSLYKIFFKTYTEKVWGIPCSQISADWAAQRIKGLSLGTAILNSFGFIKKEKIRTLIDEFYYPRRGPGQFWEKMASLIEEKGGKIILNAEAKAIYAEDNSVIISFENKGRLESIKADRLITSAPLKETVLSLNPKPPEIIYEAAQGLNYRDFFTACLIIDKENIFPDNWVYIHSPEITAGRLQNFKNWSPEMVPDLSKTSLGLEYFCFQTDPIWSKPDVELLEVAASDIEKLKMAVRSEIFDGTIIRVSKAYPVYDPDYRTKIAIIKSYLRQIPKVQVIGRNGLHRYNNQDHSMMMGIYAARNIMGAELDVWDINVEEEYHEEKA